MDFFVFTGYLTEEAIRRVRPGTNEVLLAFKICVRDSRGKECFFHAFVDEPRLVAKYEPLLTAGRAVMINGEVTTVPFIRHGVTTGHMESFRVLRAEFPNRGGKKVADDDDEAADGQPKEAA